MVIQLGSLFTFLDGKRAGNRTASAELVLGTGQIMTVRAGGSGVHSGPFSLSTAGYEVLLDHEPARLWDRYTDAVGMVYAHVPRMLVAEHIRCRGGIAQMDTMVQKRRSRVMLDVQVEVPREDCGATINAMLARVKGARLVSSHVVGL